MWHHLNLWPCKSYGTTGSVDTSLNNTQLFCCVKHRGRRGEAVEHYAKICTISTVVRWASRGCCLCCGGCLGFLARSISNSGLIMCDSARRKQVEAGMKGREGGGLLYGDRPSLPPDIMDESIDAVLCTFSADPARRGGGGGRIFGQLPMAWQLEFEFSSLCHYYAPPPPCFLLLQAHSHRKMCASTHIHTHMPSTSSKMHLSPVELWHWTVC